MKPNSSRLKFEIDSKKVSVAKLAEQSGISRQTIYDLIEGKESATLGTLTAIAKALNIPEKDLIE